MARHHSNQNSDYWEDYDADYDDPRDHGNKIMSQYHLPDPAKHGNKYKAFHDDPRDPRNQIITSHPAHHLSNNFSRSYPFPELPLHEHGRRPRLPPLDLEGSLQKKSWYTPDQIAAMGAENNRQSRRPAEGSEPFGRRGKKPVRNQKMDFPLADLLFKRASLHGQDPRSVGQWSPRHVQNCVRVSKRSPDR